MNRYTKRLFAGICAAAAAFGMLSFQASAQADHSEADVEAAAVEIGVGEAKTDSDNPTTGTAAGLAMIAVMGGSVIVSKRKSK